MHNNKPLTHLEILDAVKKLEIPRFRGVFVRDNLPVEPKRMDCGILNLDDTTGNGTHWVAWYGDNGKKYYFDSYGIQPPDELKRYLKIVTTMTEIPDRQHFVTNSVKEFTAIYTCQTFSYRTLTKIRN